MIRFGMAAFGKGLTCGCSLSTPTCGCFLSMPTCGRSLSTPTRGLPWARIFDSLFLAPPGLPELPGPSHNCQGLYLLYWAQGTYLCQPHTHYLPTGLCRGSSLQTILPKDRLRERLQMSELARSFSGKDDFTPRKDQSRTFALSWLCSASVLPATNSSPPGRAALGLQRGGTKSVSTPCWVSPFLAELYTVGGAGSTV